MPTVYPAVFQKASDGQERWWCGAPLCDNTPIASLVWAPPAYTELRLAGHYMLTGEAWTLTERHPSKLPAQKAIIAGCKRAEGYAKQVEAGGSDSAKEDVPHARIVNDALMQHVRHSDGIASFLGAEDLPARVECPRCKCLNLITRLRD